MRFLALAVALLLLLMACTQAQPTETPAPTPSPTPPPATAVATTEPTPAPILSPSPTAAATKAPTHTPAPTSTHTPAPPSEPLDYPVLGPVYSPILMGTADVRGLDPTEAVVPQLLTREELADYLIKDLEGNLEDIRNAQEVFKILELIPRNADLYQMYLDLYGEQVAGFYDSETEELYLVVDEAGGEISVLDEITLAHEFVHAIQQQHFDIQALLESAEDNSDARSAVVALVEGDASAVQFRYMFSRFSREQQMEALRGNGGGGTSAFDKTPYVLQQSLTFPYVEGFDFVTALLSSSGWDAVNAAYDDPPDSTEQILHPEKYVAGEAPIQVTIPDVAAALGEGWENAYSNVLGEFFLKTYLETRTRNRTAADAAAGWGGDGFTLLRGPDDEYTLVSLLVWDTRQDAREFFDAMTASDSVSSEDFLGLEDNRMLWVISPDREVTEQIRALWSEF